MQIATYLVPSLHFMKAKGLDTSRSSVTPQPPPDSPEKYKTFSMILNIKFPEYYFDTIG